MKNLPSISCALACLPLAFLLSSSVAVAQGASQQPGGVTVERVVDQGLVRIKIPAEEGKIAWEDVLRALLRVGHLNDAALNYPFPSGSLDLRQARSRYILMAVNVAMAPNIRVESVAATETVPEHLLVTINEDAINAKKRELSQKIRNRVTGGELRSEAFGLRMVDADAEPLNPSVPLVIAVHGFNSSPEGFEPLAREIRDAGFHSATYSYPDDQPIVESAKLLSADLKKYARDNREQKVYLIASSMGGLVSRWVIEQPELDPGNVTKLIMVGTPTHGSLLARFAFGIDVLDHATGDTLPDDVTRFYAAVEDGLSEARDDLMPDSAFLRQLNARARNPHVRYSIFLGTGGHLTQAQVDQLRERLQSASQRSTTAGLLAPYLDETLADLDEVIAGKGDGVVAVKRGRLEGVADTVVLDFTHLGWTGRQTNEAVLQGILQRLKN